MVYLIGVLSQDRAGIGAHCIGAVMPARGKRLASLEALRASSGSGAVAASRNSSRAPLGPRNLIGLKRVSSESEQRRRGVAEHAQIVNAIEKRDGDKAERLMREHIAKTRKRLSDQVRKAKNPVAA
jgi:hypothetical protein